jgi:hypothetical protein
VLTTVELKSVKAGLRLAACRVPTSADRQVFADALLEDARSFADFVIAKRMANGMRAEGRGICR